MPPRTNQLGLKRNEYTEGNLAHSVPAVDMIRSPTSSSAWLMSWAWNNTRSSK